jgi:hypothetical protein
MGASLLISAIACIYIIVMLTSSETFSTFYVLCDRALSPLTQITRSSGCASHPVTFREGHTSTGTIAKVRVLNSIWGLEKLIR